MRRGNAAFTLVEVLAALAILATAFYLLLELRQKALQNADFASTRLLAVQVARAKMEEVLARGFPDPTVETDRLAEMDITVNVMDIGDETNTRSHAQNPGGGPLPNRLRRIQQGRADMY
ncbi:MAG: prepilin-type N-terminal cleavage/methylation domain-containing protein [Planctomycetota bacterium]|nr:prepilin-type N-terminal cleavage/methylation domain-containing protein [Planctomycetota bacterium]